MSLYLKYRPQDFGSVVGQVHVVQTLQNTMKQNTLSHAYLFSGPRGTGKTSLARIVAKALNCQNRAENSPEPCHTCEICQAIGQGRLVDLIEIDAASNRGIDEIRDLREKIMFTPTQAKSKVYIIDEVHMLTKEAFNALLKTLEEPPDHAYFILATTEAHKIPETIISRCQQFSLRRIENKAIVDRLQHICTEEGIEAEEKALALIAKAAHGGLRDAIGLLEQMAAAGPVTEQNVSSQLGVSGNGLMEQFAELLFQKSTFQAIELLNQIYTQGTALSSFLEEWINHLREQMLLHLDQSQKLYQYLQWIELFTLAKQQLSQAIIPQLPIEVAIIRACDFKGGQGQLPSDEGEKPVIIEKIVQKVVQPSSSIQQAPLETEKQVEGAPSKKEASEILELAYVQQKWGQLLNAIETPFIKMSLMDAKPAELKENILYLEFNSSTLMEKIELPTSQALVMKAFEEIFNAKPTLKLSVKKIMLSPLVKVEEKSVGEKGPSLVEMAEEVFGM